MPEILTRLEQLLAETGLKDEEIVLRMTGCPNGCDRPLLGEIGLLGKAPNKYNLYLGCSRAGTRHNRLFKESVRTDDLMSERRPVLLGFAQEHRDREPFEDFCQRVILVK